MFIDTKLKINGKKLTSNQYFIRFIYDRLQGVKENVADLQQRLHQYQRKNDEMHEKIGTLERKLRESKQQCDEYSKKIVNQNADILLLSSSNERVKMLEIENQQMKIIKEQRETELLRQIRHLQDDKEELQKKLDGKRILLYFYLKLYFRTNDNN
jgi:uncharacterized coiled-coil DUF342 family protein